MSLDLDIDRKRPAIHDKLHDTITNRDFEELKRILETNQIPVEELNNYVDLYMNRAGKTTQDELGMKRCIDELFRLGATCSLYCIAQYIKRATYDDDKFQYILDHMFPKDHDTIAKMLKDVIANGENAAITKALRFAKNENFVEGRNTPYSNMLTLGDLFVIHIQTYYPSLDISNGEEPFNWSVYSKRFKDPSYTAKIHLDAITHAGIDLTLYPGLLVCALIYYEPGMPSALVDAGIPLRIAYEAPEYDEFAEYRDNISKEFHEM